MPEFNYDPNAQRYIQGDVLSPYGQAMVDYFVGVPTMRAQAMASDRGSMTGWVENPEWNPTEYRAGYGIEFDPSKGIVRQNLGLTPEQLQSEANYRDPAVQQLLAAGGAAEVTPQIQGLLDEMPATLNDIQAAAYYNQAGFQPNALPQNQYNWWAGRGTDFNDPISGGRGYWEDTVASGDQSALQQAFLKANPFLFGEGEAPPEPAQRTQDLLAPFVQSALFDVGTQGTAFQDSPLAPLAELTTLNRDVLGSPGAVTQQAAQGLVNQTSPVDFPQQTAQGLLEQTGPLAIPPQKVEQPQETPTLQRFGTPAPGYGTEGGLLSPPPPTASLNPPQRPSSFPQGRGPQPSLPSSQQPPDINGIPQNWWEGNTFRQPPIDYESYLAPHRIYEKGTGTSTVAPEQVADVVSPGTVQAPANIISGAVSQAAQNALTGTTVQGGAQLTPIGGDLFGGGLLGGLFGGQSGADTSSLTGLSPSDYAIQYDSPGFNPGGYTGEGFDPSLGDAVAALGGAVSPFLGAGIGAINAYNTTSDIDALLSGGGYSETPTGTGLNEFLSNTLIGGLFGVEGASAAAGDVVRSAEGGFFGPMGSATNPEVLGMLGYSQPNTEFAVNNDIAGLLGSYGWGDLTAGMATGPTGNIMVDPTFGLLGSGFTTTDPSASFGGLY